MDELFHAAEPLPPHARRALLAERARDDRLVCEMVLRLLAADPRARAALDGGIGELVSELLTGG